MQAHTRAHTQQFWGKASIEFEMKNDLCEVAAGLADSL